MYKYASSALFSFCVSISPSSPATSRRHPIISETQSACVDTHTMVLTTSVVGLLAFGTLSTALSVGHSPQNAWSLAHMGIEDELDTAASCVVDKPVVAHHMVGCVSHPYEQHRYFYVILTLLHIGIPTHIPKAIGQAVRAHFFI